MEVGKEMEEGIEIGAVTAARIGAQNEELIADLNVAQTAEINAAATMTADGSRVATETTFSPTGDVEAEMTGATGEIAVMTVSEILVVIAMTSESSSARLAKARSLNASPRNPLRT